MNHSIWAGALALLLAGQQQAPTTTPQPSSQAIPDAPRPQTTLPRIPSVAPANAPPSESTSDESPNRPTPSAPAAAPAASQATTPDSIEAPSSDLKAFTIRIPVNYVQVPFTVKDSKGRLVPGITYHDVRIYENNVLQHLVLFTTDSQPLSVALVIDQSMTFDEMQKVNYALAALPGAFSIYDEVAVFTYNNGTTMKTNFTGAQSQRLAAVLEQSKGTGREPNMAMGGPLSKNITTNGGAGDYTDPNTNSSHGTSLSNTENVQREIHPLSDAIYTAAQALAKTDPGKRRVIYVISNGNEYGSKMKTSEVIKTLQTNSISVYATLIHGLPSIPGTGFIDRFHIPFTMHDNLLPAYANATGGQVDPEFRTKGIETSFAKLAEEVRTQYTTGYISHEPIIDGKFRKLEIRVTHPVGVNWSVTAESGYYPTARQNRAPVTLPAPAP